MASAAASPKAELVLDRAGITPPRERADGTGQPGGSALGWARQYWHGRRVLDPAWPAGPGSVVVEGLSPGTSYEVIARAEGVEPFVAARITTLRRPRGDLLYRFATVSDLHIGETTFGIAKRIHDALEPAPSTGRPPGRSTSAAQDRAGTELCATYPVRSLRAAIEESAAWGAQLLVAKGDLTDVTRPAEVRDVACVLSESPVPVEAVLGNHDNRTGVDIRALLEARGIIVPWQPRALDVPGLRLVLASTAHRNLGYHRGQFPPEATRRVAALAAEIKGPVWVGLHHPPERWPFPTVYPPGIPFSQGRALLDELASANRAAFVSCGHRHRNRRHSYGPIPITEVGSTKDYPGVWAGYKVFEEGILQVVRRTARPDVIAWTEATRRAMNGQWGRWSPGRLRDRCFTHDWPAR